MKGWQPHTAVHICKVLLCVVRVGRQKGESADVVLQLFDECKFLALRRSWLLRRKNGDMEEVAVVAELAEIFG